ncbi:MAG TPA: ATP synthase F1 subunit delta [Candidatus Omnitrophota bacterium]|nr:ATP synthase F1 subunit delta [Candidatus Omnitrophota bacterium]HPS36209.1 ATP synthase F1 subunit delta [Candidatus Omnitrophota bacterium]
MRDTTAAGRYTRALFELAEEEQKLPEIEKALTQAEALTKTYPQIPLLVANPTLPDEEKLRLAESLIPAGAPELLNRFFRALIEKKRFGLLPEIREIFHKKFEKKQGLREVEVASAVPFSENFREKLTGFLKKKFRSEIRLIPKTETDLLGGFVLRFDGKEIDCSFKNRIHEIQQKLFNPTEEGHA